MRYEKMQEQERRYEKDKRLKNIGIIIELMVELQNKDILKIKELVDDLYYVKMESENK